MLDNGMDEKLGNYLQFKKMKGFRYVLQDKSDRALMLQPAFKTNIRHLYKYGFTYDILIFSDQLMYTNELLKEFPMQKFIFKNIPSCKSRYCVFK